MKKSLPDQVHNPPRQARFHFLCPDMRIRTQVCFSATNLPHYQNLKTQRIKIITSMCQMTLQDSSDHFYPPTGHVRP